jgi:amicyanin
MAGSKVVIILGLILFAALFVVACTPKPPIIINTTNTNTNTTIISNNNTNTVQTEDIAQNETSAGSKAYSIDISNFAFSDTVLTIKKGDTVTWTNKDSAPHTVTSDSGRELDSPRMSQSETYSHTFNTAGIFNYHCAVHPDMTAKIIVE